MATLPQISDPTLDAVDRALEAREARRLPRPYLGASAIGRACQRRLWLDFRWAGRETIDAAGLKRIEDGHRGEDVQAERLRLVDGVTLMTVDPDTGRQWGIEDHGGHFRGHMDGAIVGLLQAPATWHVWEHKQVGDDKLAKLEKFKAEVGEKAALLAWDAVYWAQAQTYMHYTGMERHYLTAASPGGRRTVSVRTEYDAAQAIRIVEKARRIIFAERPPERISTDPAYFECRWCPHAATCHGREMPARSCRTCIFSNPHPDGGWRCLKHMRGIDEVQQREGCPDQRLMPDIVPGKQTDAADDGSWIAYTLKGGQAWVDEGPEQDARAAA